MPQMANITVKKNDGVTDVVYTAIVASAGDKTSALWELTAASAVRAFRPQYSVKSEWNGAKTGRRVRDTYTYPVVQAVNGVDTVVGRINIEGSGFDPTNVDDAAIAEAVSQYANLRKSTLMLDTFKSGFSPT